MKKKKGGEEKGEREDDRSVQLSDRNAEQRIKLFLFEKRNFGFAQRRTKTAQSGICPPQPLEGSRKTSLLWAGLVGGSPGTPSFLTAAVGPVRPAGWLPGMMPEEVLGRLPVTAPDIGSGDAWQPLRHSQALLTPPNISLYSHIEIHTPKYIHPHICITPNIQIHNPIYTHI